MVMMEKRKRRSQEGVLLCRVVAFGPFDRITNVPEAPFSQRSLPQSLH